MNKQRLLSLDVLRIPATIVILFHHYQMYTGARFKYINFWDGKFFFGYLVELFFVLSGYFMVEYIDRIKKGLSFKHYMLKRIIRLLPMVAIGAIFYEIIVIVYNKIFLTSWSGVQLSVWSTIISALGMQIGGVFNDYNVNAPAWYVSVLMLCYIFFFLLTYISKKVNVSENILYAIMICVGGGYSNIRN